jgi:hypothetical protein
MQLFLILLVAAAAQAPAEKQLVFTITGDDLRGGVVSEVTWDGGTLLVQGVYAEPGGTLAAKYFVKAASTMTVEPRDNQSAASLSYWAMKSSRVSPTGLGRLSISSDTKLPQYGIASQERRFADSVDMGGTLSTHVVKLRDLKLLERTSPSPPYDGETWSWSPANLNRIAYVDGKGDLWVATADGRDPQRILRGNFLLPAWSEDGRAIAVAERKKDRWEISVVHLPPDIRQ